MSVGILKKKKEQGESLALKSSKMKLDFGEYLKRVHLHWKQVEIFCHVLRKYDLKDSITDRNEQKKISFAVKQTHTFFRFKPLYHQ